MNIVDIQDHSQRTLGHVLARQAAEIGDAIWLRADDRTLTFAEANALVNRYANGLRTLGVEPGVMITLVMKPSIELVLLALAAARLGAIYSNINTDYRGSFLQEALRDSTARVLVIDGDLATNLDELSDIGAIRHVFTYGDLAALLRHSARPLPELLSEDTNCADSVGDPLDVVQVWWSSGTTGKSKGVAHSHNSIIAFAHRNACRRLQPGDVFYSCTPMYLGSPWTGTIWLSLIGGVGAAIDARFSVSQFWDRIRFYGATSFFTLGAMHIHLWKQEPKPNDADNPVREALAVPMPYDLIPKFKERFGIESMPQAYGTSETFMIFEADDDGTPWRNAALGRPVRHMDVAILDEFNRECAVGTAGEICVRPREPGILFSGYFRDAERTVKSWRDLWHHTGDMAYQGEDGVYYFADRKADYIRYKGRNISMFEVEQVVLKISSVLDAAAFGVQSAELESESELMLCVQPKAGMTITPQEVATFIRANAPYYFVPRYIEVVEKLPQNAHGRTTKNDLRERGVSAATWDREAAGFDVKAR